VLGLLSGSPPRQSGQAYALTDAEVQPDITAAQGRTQAVDVGPCALG